MFIPNWYSLPNRGLSGSAGVMHSPISFRHHYLKLIEGANIRAVGSANVRAISDDMDPS